MFMNQNFFGARRIEITDSVQVIFVADMFVSDYTGGAELTTEALIGASPLAVIKVRSKDVDLSLLERGHSKFWIFGNFAGLDKNLIPTIIANMRYAVLEYDYKYCMYRSPEMHTSINSTGCNCETDWNGKLVSAFFHGAKSVWWMSERQKARYVKAFPTLAQTKNTVLSSVFDDATMVRIADLREKYASVERKGWIVLGSPSWIKGQNAAEEWCKANGKGYEVVWNLSYDSLLEKLASAEGFVYLPLGGDTCPRMVIEAKLLGCQLQLNENVEHAGEEWFATDDRLLTESYLYAARNIFWNGIKSDMPVVATVSGYTTTYNCIRQQYPFHESIGSMLGFSDEVIVVDGGSDDGTWEELQAMAAANSRLVIHQERRDWSSKRFAVFDGQQKALARSLCSGHFCWQQDSDEVVHEQDYAKIRNVAGNFPKEIDLVALPVIEYWGGPEKVRLDATPWKWRLSRNVPHITHGIPAALRRFDEDGLLFSAPGSDGCDYVRSDNFTPIPFAGFMSQDAEVARQHAIATGDESVRIQYQQWFQSVIEAIPSVHHYSWFDMGRKIRTYRGYWTKHWLSLYNTHQDDTAENNMFFDRPWSQVTEEDIDDLAVRLARDTGGWIFHRKLDLSRPTPHLRINRTHPAVVTEWVQNKRTQT